MNRAILSVLAATMLAGCSLAPRYERPAAPVPSAYPMADAQADTTSAAIKWQTFFGDARLRAIIGLALENNRDLRVAALRIEQARALANIQRTAFIPQLNATGDASRQRTPGDVNGTGSARTVDFYSAALEVPSYEVDFFGHVASLRDQVLQQYLATEEAARSARISLISSVARQYLALVAADEQLALANDTLASADKAYSLNKQSFDAGVASDLDLATAEAQRESVRATVAAITQQRDQAKNALTLLIGAPIPDGLPAAGTLATEDMVNELPAGLPADLLTRRPDILAAEHTLQAANANIGVARAAFFPKIELTASGGTASTALSGLFETGSGAWKFAPSITLPIFAAGQNKARLEIAEAGKRIEIANYEKAIQTAFREVADALAIRRSIDAQVNAQSARVAAAQRRYDLSNQRYGSGIDSYLTVLLAQQELYAAQQSLIQARLVKLTNLTSLYAALGGG